MSRTIKFLAAPACLWVSYSLFHWPHPITWTLATGVGVAGLMLGYQALMDDER